LAYNEAPATQSFADSISADPNTRASLGIIHANGRPARALQSVSVTIAERTHTLWWRTPRSKPTNSDAQISAERFELCVGDDAARMQFGQLPERLGRIGRRRIASSSRGGPGPGAPPDGAPHEQSARPSARLDAHRTTR
jgi:hypothetical protein